MFRLSQLLVGTLFMAISTVPFAAGKAVPVSADKELTRAQALKIVDNSEPDKRLAAVERLAVVGTMADADKLVTRLHDENENVRELAQAAIWHIWSRSGDPEIDALYQQGIHQMQAANLDDALTTFNEIIRRKPSFAEGWNKRATILYMTGEHRQSLKDCDEVLKRNPKHFGALSGAGQIHLQLGHPELALDFFRRALAVNPNLEGAAAVIPVLEELLREQQPQRT